MRVAILFNALPANPTEDDRDVLEQVRAVSAALTTLGHSWLELPATLDLEALRDRLNRERPDVVFNLVESLGGSDWLIHVVPSLLDVLRLPYTGSPSQAVFLSTEKLLAKQRLNQSGLPTPAWVADDGKVHGGADCPPARWIVKTVWEHASFAIGDDSLLTSPPGDWPTVMEAESRRLGRPCFAEQFIDGREFNLSVLAGSDGPQVLPPAEIDFSAFGAERPRIVGYRAKWIADSSEYVQTPRRFDFSPADRPLLERLSQLAERCWHLFGMRGYARVDFRVDRAGEPWILEINANPCLSPDAGFAAALQQAGIPYAEAVRRILDDALAAACLP